VIAVAYNASDGPVVIDEEGRILGGGEWGVVDNTEGPAKQAAEAGDLHIFPDLDEGPGQNPAAIDAIRRASGIRERQGAFAALEKKDLDKTAAEAEIPGREEMDKDRLVSALAFRTTINTPEPKKAASPKPKAQE
jgi:hypothetical protein